MILNKSLVIYSLLVLIFTGCDYRFESKPDKNDYIIYQSGSGELGSSWVKIIFHGDGSVGYFAEYPYEEIQPHKVISGTYKLSMERAEKLFQSLIDAGLFSLKDKTMQGADLPFTSISANIDGHTLDVSWNVITDSDSDQKYSKVNILILEILQELDMLQPIRPN
jgi:hypothetical protein